MGAPRLHIVDLDGAASGTIQNLEIITNIAKVMLIPVQLGGGIRDIETIKALLQAGIERIILGTIAVENPKLIIEACRQFRESIIVGIDARDGFIATRGWKTNTELTTIELAKSMMKNGVRRFIYTDINRDGTLTEPNFSAIADLINTIGVPVIAAGGVATLNHLKMLQKLGAEGAIIGKALYTGDIRLKQAISELNQT